MDRNDQMPSSVTSSAIYGGIFTTEPGQRLLTITEHMAKRGFEGLYEKCKNNIGGTYFQTGLRRVHLWSNEVIDEDLEYVRGRCADLDETYEACFADYISERYRGNNRPTINCPPILTFARRFLESVAQQDSVTNGEFFSSRDPLMRRVTCMEATRSALYALVTSETLRIELASEVGSVRRERSLADTDPVDLGRYQRSTVEATAASEVKPEDSVSQVESVRSSRIPTRRPTTPPPPPERPTAPIPRPVTPPPVHNERDDDERSVTVISTKGQRERMAPTQQTPEEPPPPSRHDFHVNDEWHNSPRSPRESVASLRTRSAVGSASSSVSIGMKRVKSPRN